MKKITVIEAKKGVTAETYYEPVAPRAELSLLRRLGWGVRTRRVVADKLVTRLRRRAEAMSRQAAALAGASSMCHAFALGEGWAEAEAAKVLAAANGHGSLLT